MNLNTAPRGKYFEDFQVGDELVTPARTITSTDIVNFACLSGDFNEVHVNHEYCKTTPFGRRIAHGALTLSYATGLLARSGWFDETALAFLSIERWAFKGPVFIGDTIRLTATTVDARVSKSKGDRGPWTGQLVVSNQRDEVVQEGLFTIMMRARGTAA